MDVCPAPEVTDARGLGAGFVKAVTMAL